MWAEGPHVYPHPDGGWMLLASEGGTYDDHALSVAYADEIQGPYRGDSGNPRLTHRDLGSRAEIWGVGHADLVEAPDGRTWAALLASHALDGEDGLLGRQTHLVPVDWEGGRPLFAPRVGRVERLISAEGVPDQAPRPTDFRESFDADAIGPEWNGARNFPSVFADVRERPGHVRLRAGCEPTQLGVLAFLGRRLPAARVMVRATFELAPGEVGVLRAGLLLRLSEAAHLEVAADAAGAVCVRLVQPEGQRIIGETEGRPGAPIEIGLRIDGFRGDAFEGDELVATVDLRPLSPSAAGSFLGCWVGPFAVGDGHVDIDTVEIRTLDHAE